MSQTSIAPLVRAVAALSVLLSFTACSGGSPATPPTALAVISSSPLTDAVDVPVDGTTSATFNMAMDPATITTATFTLSAEAGAIPVAGTVTSSSTTATFQPSADLENDSWYAASITTGARSERGDSLQEHRSWRFKTGGRFAAPRVMSTTPIAGAIGVLLTVNPSATFSKAMDPDSINASTFTVTFGPSSVPVQGAVSSVGSRAVFVPVAQLESNGVYTATISSGARSTAGVALKQVFAWSFTTGDVNTTIPTVISTSPVNGAIGVPVTENPSATFSEAMNPASLTASTFTLTSGPALTPVQGTVTTSGSTAVFTPSAPLEANGSFTATITTGATSALGVAFAASSSWSFSTRGTLPPGLPVNLGTAGDFAILSKSGISTVPASAITGNIGVSPIAGIAVTGFALTADFSNVFSTSSQVTGKVYAADYAAPTPSNLTTAVSDMETAFTDAAGRAAAVTELGAGNIGGMTLVPGVYKWGTGVLIPTDLTLSGSATDVWIFQIAQDLYVSSAVKVTLAGGAVAKNVFWQVSGRVVLDTTAHLEGVVLSQTAITLATGASINGRLLAQTAVTLDGSTVVEPAP